jgi:3-oxoadipate enol-lactonase
MKLSLNDFEMNYTVEGPERAPWLTFVNSLVTSLEMWDAEANALKDRYRVLRYDMRGHGRSSAPPAPYTITQLADDALALWDKLGVDRSHWVGLSLGGMIGINLAARHPQRFRSLVAADCRADANEAYGNVFVERIRLTREQGMDGIVDPTMQRFFTPAFVAANKPIIERFSDMIRKTSAEGHIGCCQAIQKLAEGGNLPKLTVPAMFIGGEHDLGGPPELMRAMAAATPGARYVMIEGAGHISNIEKPARFLAEIEAFIAAH